MLACRIHAKEDLRIEPLDGADAGPRRGAAAARRRRHLRLRPALLLRGPQRQLRRSRAADPRPRGVRRRRGGRPGRHAREERRQGRGLAVACLRPLRRLPRGPRAAVLEHALPRQREPVPARAGNVPGVLRDGRAPVLSGGRRRHARRARVRRAARGRPALGQPRRRPVRQVGARHRRRDDRLPHRAWRRGSPARRKITVTDVLDRPLEQAREGRRRRRRCAPTATATKLRDRRSSTSATRSPATSTRSRPASRR